MHADAIELIPLSTRPHFESVVDYFHDADDAFLEVMGVDRKRLPERETWIQRLLADLERPDAEKQTFFLGWEYEGKIVGHSNINKIRYGEDAFIHLHIWHPELRRGGLGTLFFKRSANAFMKRFRLKRLLCEPRAENAAPNKVLSKLGFRFVKRYRTVPGQINHEQEVNRYELDHEMA
ncbi:GNAT family N-acetyltransferase [bacterium]|nr:GNAT family N-acetyltransferase [bacterium]